MAPRDGSARELKFRYSREFEALVDETGRPLPPHGPLPAGFSAPYIQPDIHPYKSIVSGRMVGGRAARREDLARTHCREVDPSECTVKEEVAALHDKRLKQNIPAGVIA